STDRSCQASSIYGKWSHLLKRHWASSCVRLWWIAVACVFAITPANPSNAANAIYDALVGPGVKVSPQETLHLPKLVLADNLAPAQQRQVIESLLAGKYDWDTFTRKSVVSPFILKISEGAAESGPIIRRVDIYLVAFGSLDLLKSEDYLTKQLNLAANNDQSD